MDVEKLRKRVAYIEALDRDQFASALALSLPGDDARASAERLAPLLLEYIRAAPEILGLMSAWATRVPDGDRFVRLVHMADSYFRLQEDDLDEQRHKLMGLLDDAYLVSKLAEQFVASGMPYGAMEQLSQFTKVAATLLGEELVARLHARITDAGGLPAKHPVSEVDRRMLGVWHHKTFYESGDFSHWSIRSRLFGADGRYVEGDQSFVGMVYRASSGEEMGWTDTSRASPGSRGLWTLSGTVLTLRADIGASYEFKIEIYSDSILLTQPRREPELWTRR